MVYITLDRYTFATNDYGTDTIFRLYNDDRSTVFNASTYTGVIKILDVDKNQVVNDLAVSWTNQAQGIGSFSFSQNDTISTNGRYYVEIELTKANTKVSSFPAAIEVFKSP